VPSYQRPPGRASRAPGVGEEAELGPRTLVRSYQGEVDLFLVYCPQTDRVYALSPDEVASSSVSLRIDPTGNGQMKGIRWAADHELPA
jgi:hypothetical protein